ncbi:hypothetical protein M9H77_29868 [Catharanthus roseus]|uniref:Uncharacterized protein n=1 Tax=Catharanthus roseus TaxID=4058 RepID=A0ACB9ZZI1_CATRO|nr:hypothetical protein M9H77_29868 [Catharanthus roseus]
MTFLELLSMLQLLFLCFAQSTNSSLELKILAILNKCPRLIYSSGSKNSSNILGESGLDFLPVRVKLLLKLKKKNDFLTSKPVFSCSNSSRDSIR